MTQTKRLRILTGLAVVIAVAGCLLLLWWVTAQPGVANTFTAEEERQLLANVQLPPTESLDVRWLSAYPAWQDPFYMMGLTLDKDGAEAFLDDLSDYRRDDSFDPSAESPLKIGERECAPLSKWVSRRDDRHFIVYDYTETSVILQVLFTYAWEETNAMAWDKARYNTTSTMP